MDVVVFNALPAPESHWPAAVIALWHAARDDWHAAHDALQDAGGADADWVHAHLHRIEGDVPNAAYWYRRAQRPVPAAGVSFAAEWHDIAAVLLERL